MIGVSSCCRIEAENKHLRFANAASVVSVSTNSTPFSNKMRVGSTGRSAFNRPFKYSSTSRERPPSPAFVLWSGCCQVDKISKKTNANAVKTTLTERLRSSLTILFISARAASGADPPGGCPFWTRASSWDLNLTRVWSQLLSSELAFLASLMGPYLRDALVGGPRWRPDDEATGVGLSIPGAASLYETA